MTKKFVSLFLALSMCLTLSVPAFAAEDEKAAAEAPYAFSFIDGEGKINTIHLSIPKMGASHVDYYIDGDLIYSVDSECMEAEKASMLNGADIPENVYVHITHTNAKTGVTTQYTEPVSHYITTSQDVAGNTPAKAASTYVYQGRINYNPCYDAVGNAFLYKLNVYYRQEGETEPTHKTINAEAGALLGAIVSIVTSVLLSRIPGAQEVVAKFVGDSASKLVTDVIAGAGGCILGGVVQNKVSGTYDILLTKYKVKAVDPDTSREQIYDAERYQLKSGSGGYSSEYHYDGCMPWNKSIVANWMYSDFWGDNCPGVKSYS